MQPVEVCIGTSRLSHWCPKLSDSEFDLYYQAGGKYLVFRQLDGIYRIQNLSPIETDTTIDLYRTRFEQIRDAFCRNRVRKRNWILTMKLRTHFHAWAQHEACRQRSGIIFSSSYWVQYMNSLILTCVLWSWPQWYYNPECFYDKIANRHTTSASEDLKCASTGPQLLGSTNSDYLEKLRNQHRSPIILDSKICCGQCGGSRWSKSKHGNACCTCFTTTKSQNGSVIAGCNQRSDKRATGGAVTGNVYVKVRQSASYSLYSRLLKYEGVYICFQWQQH